MLLGELQIHVSMSLNYSTSSNCQLLPQGQVPWGGIQLMFSEAKFDDNFSRDGFFWGIPENSVGNNRAMISELFQQSYEFLLFVPTSSIFVLQRAGCLVCEESLVVLLVISIQLF